MGTFISSGDALRIIDECRHFKRNDNRGTLHIPTHSAEHESLCGVMGVVLGDDMSVVEQDNPNEIQAYLCKNCYGFWKGEFPNGRDR